MYLIQFGGGGGEARTKMQIGRLEADGNLTGDLLENRNQKRSIAGKPITKLRKHKTKLKNKPGGKN